MSTEAGDVLRAERGGDDLGVGGVDQVGQAGAAHGAGGDADRVKQVGEVGGGGWLAAGLGAFGDKQVRVVGALGASVG